MINLLNVSHHEATQLADLRDSLSEQVTVRTADLQQALATVEAKAQEQAQLLAENAQQREVIRQLSVPVLPISNQTLVMPLVGIFDHERLVQAQAQALNSIKETSARRIIMDITGISMLDSDVAKGLISIVQAAKLMGTEIVLVGIRPEVAQSLISANIYLDDMTTASSLQTAVQRFSHL